MPSSFKTQAAAHCSWLRKHLLSMPIYTEDGPVVTPLNNAEDPLPPRSPIGSCVCCGNPWHVSQDLKRGPEAIIPALASPLLL